MLTSEFGDLIKPWTVGRVISCASSNLQGARPGPSDVWSDRLEHLQLQLSIVSIHFSASVKNPLPVSASQCCIAILLIDSTAQNLKTK